MNQAPELPTRNRGQNLTPDLVVPTEPQKLLVAPDQSTLVTSEMDMYPGEPQFAEQVKSKPDEALIEQIDRMQFGRKIFALADENEEEVQPVRFIPTRDEDGELVVNDEFKRASRELAEAAHREKHLLAEAEVHPVTGLPNSKAFNKYLEKVITNPDDEDIAVAMLDLDGFKNLNDTFGHAMGDRILKAFGDRLQTLVRPDDLVAALGGDEFGVVMPHYVRDNPDMKPEERQLAMTERFRSVAAQVIDEIKSDLEVVEMITKAKSELTFNTSVGIALRAKRDTVESLKHRADEKMYEDKNSRKEAKGKRVGRALAGLRGLFINR